MKFIKVIVIFMIGYYVGRHYDIRITRLDEEEGSRVNEY